MQVDISSLKIRALFLSDFHLGFRLANAKGVLAMLQRVNAPLIYLVGDTIDYTRLLKHWYWPESYEKVIEQLEVLRQSGVEMRVCPGNHDICLRDDSFTSQTDSTDRIGKLFTSILKMDLAESFIHETANGRRLLVTHGDRHDDFHQQTGGVTTFGTRVFDHMLWWLPKFVVLMLRRIFKTILANPRHIETKIVQDAKSQKLDGVIFGHIHTPSLNTVDGFITANTGDWVENQSFLAELENGELVLINSNRKLATA